MRLRGIPTEALRLDHVGASSGVIEAPRTTGMRLRGIAPDSPVFSYVGSPLGSIIGPSYAASGSIRVVLLDFPTVGPVDFVNSATDTVSVQDDLTAIRVSGSDPLSFSTADSVGVSDSLSTASGLVKSLTDLVGVGDSFVKAVGKTVSDAVGVTDSLVKASGRDKTDLVGVLDSGSFSLESFVTRDSTTGNLMLNGERFRFGGNNGSMAGLVEDGTSYGETISGGLHTMNHAAIDAYFTAAEGMEARVARVWLMQMGTPNSFMPSITSGTTPVFNDAAFEGYDYALTKCPAAGLKVIFVLSDNYDYFTGGKYDWCTLSGVTPDGNASQFFTNAQVIANFKTFISHMLNHVNVYTGLAYKDEPSILAWETGNELEVGGAYPQTLLDWTSDIADYIKNTAGAQQLVVDGKGGLLGPSNVVSEAHMNDPNIDIYTEHTYDQWRTPAYMVNQAAVCHNYGKAFFVGEYPVAGASGWTQADLISAIEGNRNVDGDLLWNLLPQGGTHGGGFVIHYPGDDATMISRVTAQKNHAIAMAGSTLSNATTPAKTFTLVGPDVDSSKWNVRSTANISGGQIILPSGDTGYSSAVKYDLTNSEFSAELVQDNPGTGGSYCGMMVQATQAPAAAPQIGFLVIGNTMTYRYNVSGVSDTTETYNSTTHRWVRLRASAKGTNLTAYPAPQGSVYWDVSSDGVNWVNKRTVSPVDMVLTSVYPILINVANGDGGSGTAIFDSVNAGSGFAVTELVGVSDSLLIEPRFVGANDLVGVSDSSTFVGSQFVNDTFTDTNGVLLHSHTGESGATWAKQTGAGTGGGNATVQTNRIWTSSADYYASGTPPSANYSVTGNVQIVSALASAQAKVMGRMVTNAMTEYAAILLLFSGTYYLYLRRVSAGSALDLGGSPIALTGGAIPSVGSSHDLTLVMNGSSLSVLWDGVTKVGPVTNTDITAAGKAGLGGTTMTSSTGFHFNSFKAEPM